MNGEDRPDQPGLFPEIYHAEYPTVQQAAANASEPDRASRSANPSANRSSRVTIVQRGADPELMEFARDLARQDDEGVANRYEFDPKDGSVTVLNKPRRLPRGQRDRELQENRPQNQPLVLPQGVIDAVIEEVADGDEDLVEMDGSSITIHNQPPSPKK